MSNKIIFVLALALVALLGGSVAEAHGYRYHHYRHAYRHHHWHRGGDATLIEGDPAPALEAQAMPSLGGEESSGLASWYRGRGGGLTAAHRTYPFGTRVLVTNRSNGRSVVVRINDRGPFIRGRVIDLNHASASAIGVTGVSPVVLRRL